MCGLRTRPLVPPSNCRQRGHIISPPPGRYLFSRVTAQMRPIATTEWRRHRLSVCVSVGAASRVAAQETMGAHIDVVLFFFMFLLM